MDNLKACPFCGGAAYLQQNYSKEYGKFFVFGKCSICGAQGKKSNSKEDAVLENWNNSACNAAAAAWNTRQPADPNE